MNEGLGLRQARARGHRPRRGADADSIEIIRGWKITIQQTTRKCRRVGLQLLEGTRGKQKGYSTVQCDTREGKAGSLYSKCPGGETDSARSG